MEQNSSRIWSGNSAVRNRYILKKNLISLLRQIEWVYYVICCRFYWRWTQPSVNPDVRLRPIRLHVSPRNQSTLQEVYLPVGWFLSTPFKSINVVITSQALLNRLKQWMELQGAHLIEFQGLHLSSVEPEPQLSFITGAHYGDVMDYIARDPKCNRLSLVSVISSIDLSSLLTLDFVSSRMRCRVWTIYTATISFMVTSGE